MIESVFSKIITHDKTLGIQSNPYDLTEYMKFRISKIPLKYL